jgi:tRNA(Ile)-lysidine synthase
MRLSLAATQQSHSALTGCDFAVLMAPLAPFESRPHLAVAVSGGRDSLALAVLAYDWVRARSGQLTALIVDHGLRQESAGEAEATRRQLGELGIQSEILRWQGAKSLTGLQEAARTARYRLLLEACRSHDILHLLVAHHAEDQRETVAMRAARDSGADGLAGMAALVELREARLLRPLLGVPRDRLTATLEMRGLTWVDDPSNLDPRFERARLRAKAPAAVSGWRQAGVERSRCEAALAWAAVELVEAEPNGRIAFDQVRFCGLERDLQHRLVSRLVQALGGAHYPPRRHRLKAAALRLSRGGDRGKTGKSQDFTLSGCRMMLRQWREKPDIEGRKSRRTRWIVGPESGRNNSRKGVQPLVPPPFLACGGALQPHLGS